MRDCDLQIARSATIAAGRPPESAIDLLTALCRARVASGVALVGDGKQDTRERYGT
jgi:hypothetical protein